MDAGAMQVPVFSRVPMVSAARTESGTARAVGGESHLGKSSGGAAERQLGIFRRALGGGFFFACRRHWPARRSSSEVSSMLVGVRLDERRAVVRLRNALGVCALLVAAGGGSTIVVRETAALVPAAPFVQRAGTACAEGASARRGRASAERAGVPVARAQRSAPGDSGALRDGSGRREASRRTATVPTRSRRNGQTEIRLRRTKRAALVQAGARHALSRLRFHDGPRHRSFVVSRGRREPGQSRRVRRARVQLDAPALIAVTDWRRFRRRCPSSPSDRRRAFAAAR